MTPITTTAELAAFCDKLQGQPFVAVDTEFMRETTYWPKLCLIQAAAPNAEAVIDPLAEGIDLEPVLAVLRDEKILKVFHAARQDVEIFNNLKAMPRPLFDTQVAGMAAGFGEQIAYDALVRQMLKVEIESYLHLISFEEGRIEARFHENAPADLAGRLMQRLRDWTGRHWSVLVNAQERGADTLRDARTAEVMAHPFVQRAFEVFPGVEISAIRDRNLKTGEDDPVEPPPANDDEPE